MAFHRTMSERLTKYRVDEKTGCWLWTGAKDKDGYGYMVGSVNNVRWSKKAHRASYEHYIGPIPEGYDILHDCDTPGCINPKHLHLGDAQLNSLEMVARGRTNNKKGADHHNYGKRHSEEIRERISQGVRRYLARIHRK